MFYKKLVFSILIGLFCFTCFGCQNQNSDNIIVYTRDTTSGTRDGFFSTIGFDEAVKDNTVLVNGYVEVASNGAMVNALQNDDYGIGYISLTSLADSNLKGLNFNDVEPTEDNVINDTYGLTRNFNYVVRNEFDSLRVSQIVDAFLAFLGTKDAKTTIIGEGGIVSISNDDPTWDEIKGDYPISNEDNSNVTIRFGGSTSVENIAKALSAEFSNKCGNFVREHNHTGSGDAYKRTQGTEKDSTNALDIAFASREFNQAEPVASGTYGKICVDAIVTVVNKNNEISNITAQTLKDIYNGTITKWSEINR